MYDLIYQMINHVWQTTGSTGDQQYIYFISCVMICVLMVTVIDMLYRVIYGLTSLAKNIQKGD